MRLGQWLRGEVWGARDWSVRLVSLAHDVRAAPLEPALAEKALALAEACEAIVPSRSTAIEMYVTAWKAARAHPHALARARYLCREIGNLELAAKIARLEYQHSKNPEHQLMEGLAWLDAQNPDRALRPLLVAAKANRSDPLVQRALEIARREWTDVRGEIARLETAAHAEGDPHTSAELLLDAARIAGMLATDETYERLLVAAFHLNPLDESVHDLVMQRMGERRDYTRLDDLVAVWAGAAKSAQQRVEVYRRVGLDESLMAVQPELAARMVYDGLRIAYRHALPRIPGHVAMVARLRTVLARTGDLERLLAVLRIGVERDHSEDEKLWFAINGLDVAWNSLSNADEAERYAAIVQDMAPTHSVLHDYISGGGGTLRSASQASAFAPARPPTPTPTFAPTPTPPFAPTPTPTPTLMFEPPAVFESAAPAFEPDEVVFDLSSLGEQGSMPSIPLPEPIDASWSADGPGFIDLPMPPGSAPDLALPPGPRSADRHSAPADVAVPPIDPSFLFEPVPPPLPPPGGADMEFAAHVDKPDEELSLDELDDHDAPLLVHDEQEDELMLDDDDVELVSDDDLEFVPDAPPVRVPSPPAAKRTSALDGAGPPPPPPPRFYAPGFSPPSKIPNIPIPKKPSGDEGR